MKIKQVTKEQRIVRDGEGASLITRWKLDGEVVHTDVETGEEASAHCEIPDISTEEYIPATEWVVISTHSYDTEEQYHEAGWFFDVQDTHELVQMPRGKAWRISRGYDSCFTFSQKKTKRLQGALSDEEFIEKAQKSKYVYRDNGQYVTCILIRFGG